MATATKNKPTTKKTKSTKLSIKPLHDKVIVRRDEAETQTASGIFLPESAKDQQKTGVILAVGDGALNRETGDRIPLSVTNGDRVIFSSYAGNEVKVDGEELLIMSESDILAIID
ncbi:MAG: co-chaperone GroES [Phycisphaerales bacterium]|nr:co-chaperone GroES [bacterium]